MRIVCDRCGTPYAIDDARLPRETFKIRCGRCAHLVVVGPRREQPDHWHMLVNGLQVGPLTSTEVREQLSEGQLDGDTYLWRAGFPDWRPLSEIEEFRSSRLR